MEDCREIYFLFLFLALIGCIVPAFHSGLGLQIHFLIHLAEICFANLGRVWIFVQLLSWKKRAQYIPTLSAPQTKVVSGNRGMALQHSESLDCLCSVICS